MFLTEYDEEKTMKMFYRDGLKEGEAKGRREALEALVKSGVITEEQAAEATNRLGTV